MKELSTEEKAKYYDEAIVYAKKLLKTIGNATLGNLVLKNEFKNMFPALEESEDERIRQSLAAFFAKFKQSDMWDADFSFGDILAWFEKQGEPIDKIVKRATTEKQRVLVTESNGVANIDWDTRSIQDVKLLLEYGLGYINKLEKQGEQKPTDKVEPKFKVGDWVILTAGELSTTLQIVNVDTNKKLYLFNDNSYLPIVDEECLHLWTIQDAKDGDVLVCESGWTCIFKTLVNDETFSSYCFMDNTKWFCETGSECHTLNKEFTKAYNGEIKPATKEQRDLLFAKMREAGYEWDAEKKELKKIENEIEIPFGAKDSELQEVTYFIPNGFHAEIDDDKVVIMKGDKPTTWSEEDEEKIDTIRKTLVRYISYDGITQGEEVRLDNWLKSLKERYTWKPSEEQMKILNEVLNFAANHESPHWNDYIFGTLNNLIRQLRKLREE